MTRVVWKHAVPVGDSLSYCLPADARVVHVGAQYDVPYVWIEMSVSDTAQRAGGLRTFEVRATGQTFEDGTYLGTVHLADGFVGHVYEL